MTTETATRPASKAPAVAGTRERKPVSIENELAKAERALDKVAKMVPAEQRKDVQRLSLTVSSMLIAIKQAALAD